MWLRIGVQSGRAAFTELAGDLFEVMATVGRVGFETVAWFNGGLFDDNTTLPLERSPTSRRCWRHQTWTGRSSTRRSSARCSSAASIPASAPVGSGEGRHRGRAGARQGRQVSRGTDRNGATKPSRSTGHSSSGYARSRCSTRRAARGTSSYLALQALKDLEHRVQLEAEALDFQRVFPEVGPANVKGIELNPYAAKLARVSVWIGEIQWMRRSAACWSPPAAPAGSHRHGWSSSRRALPCSSCQRRSAGPPNGFAEARDPILKPLGTIECRDAILTADNAERRAVGDRRRGGASVVGLLLARRRRVRIRRIASTVGPPMRSTPILRRGAGGAGIDLTGVRRLPENAGLAFMGDTKRGPFRRRRGPGARVAPSAREPERANQRRRAEAVGERDEPDPAAGRKVDCRLRVDDVSRQRGAVRGAVPVGERACPPDAPAEPLRSVSRVLVAAR